MSRSGRRTIADMGARTWRQKWRLRNFSHICFFPRTWNTEFFCIKIYEKHMSSLLGFQANVDCTTCAQDPHEKKCSIESCSILGVQNPSVALPTLTRYPQWFHSLSSSLERAHLWAFQVHLLPDAAILVAAIPGILDGFDGTGWNSAKLLKSGSHGFIKQKMVSWSPAIRGNTMHDGKCWIAVPLHLASGFGSWIGFNSSKRLN